jgi:hypothetical protein
MGKGSSELILSPVVSLFIDTYLVVHAQVVHILPCTFYYTIPSRTAQYKHENINLIPFYANAFVTCIQSFELNLYQQRKLFYYIPHTSTSQTKRPKVYSISMVPGGLLVKSYATRQTPSTSLTIRVATLDKKS